MCVSLTALVHEADTLGGVNLLATNLVMDDFYPADLQVGADPYGYFRVAVLPVAIQMDGCARCSTSVPATKTPPISGSTPARRQS